jgi:uncharacterized protein
VRLIRSLEYRRMRWRNGAGETAEIARSPADASLDDFDWRISTAEIGVSGPFSVFPAIDRTLLVLSGAGLDLAVGDSPILRLHKDSDPYGFHGDTPTMASLVDGPIRDFNVMTRRNRVAQRVRRITTKVPLRLDRPDDVHGIHVSAGNTEFSCSGEIGTLNTGDTLLCDRSTADAVEIRPFSIAEIIVIDLQQLAR